MRTFANLLTSLVVAGWVVAIAILSLKKRHASFFKVSDLSINSVAILLGASLRRGFGNDCDDTNPTALGFG
jgi:vancomycin permeability regulator SanA